MKNLNLTLLLLLFLINCACNVEENEPLLSSDEVEESESYDIESLQLEIERSLGEIIELDEYYLVENDLLIPKESILEYINESKSKQVSETGRHFYTSTINTPNSGKRTINIYWDKNGFPTSDFTKIIGVPDNSFQTALSLAIGSYNNEPSMADLEFELNEVSFITHFFNPSGTDIIIENDGNTLPNNVYAAAGFPSGGDPYNTILINLDFLNNFPMSLNQKRYNIMHEIGHCIGFRHTNLRLLGESLVNANPIFTTPNAEDPNSVFNGGTALNSGSWSNDDITALRTLY